jgi:hypothetical protein
MDYNSFIKIVLLISLILVICAFIELYINKFISSYVITLPETVEVIPIGTIGNEHKIVISNVNNPVPEMHNYVKIPLYEHIAYRIEKPLLSLANGVVTTTTPVNHIYKIIGSLHESFESGNILSGNTNVNYNMYVHKRDKPINAFIANSKIYVT